MDQRNALKANGNVQKTADLGEVLSELIDMLVQMKKEQAEKETSSQ